MRTSAARARSSRPPGQGGVVGCALHSEQRRGFELIAIVSAGAGQHPQKKTTPVGFEPTRGDPIGLAGRRLNRSAKVSLLKLAVERTRLPLPGDRMLWLDAPDTYVHLAIPLFRGAPNLACQPQLGEQNFQIFNNMNAPLAQWLERWSYEP